MLSRKWFYGVSYWVNALLRNEMEFQFFFRFMCVCRCCFCCCFSFYCVYFLLFTFHTDWLLSSLILSFVFLLLLIFIFIIFNFISRLNRAFTIHQQSQCFLLLCFFMADVLRLFSLHKRFFYLFMVASFIKSRVCVYIYI